MHLDRIAARRTQPGGLVAHGFHMLLWALDSLAASGRIVTKPARLKVKFLKWAYLDEELALSLQEADSADLRRFQVQVGDVVVLSGELSYQQTEGELPGNYPVPSPVAPRAIPLERSLADLDNCRGDAYTPEVADACALFPDLAALLSGTAVAELAACSYVVGMEAPGLHSINSKLDLTIGRSVESAFPRAALRYHVQSCDERFRKVRIAVAGRAISGTLEAFVRVPPVEQPSLQTITDRVEPSEFAGMKALIIGGSRGLGELTAKLIAAGGGSPAITWAVGKADAERVFSQIRQWSGDVEMLQYDARLPPDPQLEGVRSRFTHLFYFATNPIFRPRGKLVSQSVLDDFMTFYVRGFYDLCLRLIAEDKADLLARRRLVAYYPSSVAVEERPAGMTEYSMAKAAGEQMCRDMNRYLPRIQILVTRLPRLRTDQTASIMPERELDPIGVLLTIIRRMRGMAASDEVTSSSESGERPDRQPL